MYSYCMSIRKGFLSWRVRIFLSPASVCSTIRVRAIIDTGNSNTRGWHLLALTAAMTMQHSHFPLPTQCVKRRRPLIRKIVHERYQEDEPYIFSVQSTLTSSHSKLLTLVIVNSIRGLYINSPLLYKLTLENFTEDYWLHSFLSFWYLYLW